MQTKVTSNFKENYMIVNTIATAKKELYLFVESCDPRSHLSSLMVDVSTTNLDISSTTNKHKTISRPFSQGIGFTNPRHKIKK